MNKSINYITILVVLLGGVVFYFGWYRLFVPKILSIPDNFDYSADIISKDNFYDEKSQGFLGEQVSVTKFLYEIVDLTDNKFIVRNIFDVRSTKGEKIFSVQRLYGIDPATGRHVVGYGDRDRDGYLFAPRNLKQGQSFTYWHINYDAPATLTFMGIERIHDLEVFRYEADYHADQTKELANLPEVGETLGINLDIHLTVWVDPVSGRFINYEDQTTAYYYDLKTGERLHPWNRFSNTYTSDSIQKQVRAASNEKSKITLVQRDVPLVFSFTLFVLLAYLMRSVFLKSNSFSKILNQRISFQLVSVVTASCGALVLLGWMFDIEVFKRIYPTFTAMNPMTAVTFILTGFAIYWWSQKKQLALFLLLIISCIAVLRLCAIYLGFPFQVDLLLFRRALEVPENTVRMSVVTAINFLLVSAVLIRSLFSSQGNNKLSQIVSWILIVLSMSGVFAYIFGGYNFLTQSIFRSLALHTTLLFVLIGLFLAFMHEEDETDGVRVSLLVRGIGYSLGLLFPITLVLSVSSFAQYNFNQKLEAKFENETKTIEEAIVQRGELYKNTLIGGKALFASSEGVERKEWEAYAKETTEHMIYPVPVTLSYAKRVLASEKTAFEESIQAEGFTNFTIWPTGDRPEYFPVTFIEPFSGTNILALGYDVASDPIRNAALTISRDSGQPTISGKINLVQDEGWEDLPSFLMIAPLYQNGVPTDTLDQRRAALIGYVSSPFRTQDFMLDVFDPEVSDIDVQIFDGLIGESDVGELFHSVAEETSGDSSASLFTKHRTIYMTGHPWIVKFTSRRDFRLSTVETLIPRLLLIGGSVVSFILIMLFYSLITSQSRAVEIANRATDKIVMFKRAIDSSSNHIIVTDADGRITYANEAAVQMTGFAKEEMIGQKPALWGKQMTRDFYDTLWDTIKNKRQTFEGEIINRRKDGKLYHALAIISPIIDHGDLIGFVGSEADISSLKRKEADLTSRTKELERLNQLMIGRELKMQELKNEIAHLKKKLSEKVQS